MLKFDGHDHRAHLVKLSFHCMKQIDRLNYNDSSDGVSHKDFFEHKTHRGWKPYEKFSLKIEMKELSELNISYVI